MDIIHILFHTGFTIILLLFSFLTDYVTIEKRMTYEGGILAVLIMFTFIGSGTNNFTRNELMVFTFICLCLSFLYTSAIERTKRKFRIEKDMQDVQQSLWKGQLKQLLIA